MDYVSKQDHFVQILTIPTILNTWEKFFSNLESTHQTYFLLDYALVDLDGQLFSHVYTLVDVSMYFLLILAKVYALSF